MSTLAEPWVVKLGGSLCKSGVLSSWLELLRAHTGTPLLVVAGGGQFADCVRDSQQHWGFSDQAAHRMAVRAMEQHACMIADLAGNLPTVAGFDACRQALQQEPVVVWMPSQDVDHHCRLPANWKLTSDSLALWLAQKLGIINLVLVKSVAPDDVQADSAELVDACFPTLLKTTRVSCWWLGPEHSGKLSRALRCSNPTGLYGLNGRLNSSGRVSERVKEDG